MWPPAIFCLERCKAKCLGMCVHVAIVMFKDRLAFPTTILLPLACVTLLIYSLWIFVRLTSMPLLHVQFRAERCPFYSALVCMCEFWPSWPIARTCVSLNHCAIACCCFSRFHVCACFSSCMFDCIHCLGILLLS